MDIDWKNSEFAVQCRLKYVWFQAKSFGECLEAEHIMVKQADLSCPFSDDELVAEA